jgi:hypothetical protein
MHYCIVHVNYCETPSRTVYQHKSMDLDTLLYYFIDDHLSAEIRITGFVRRQYVLG